MPSLKFFLIAIPSALVVITVAGFAVALAISPHRPPALASLGAGDTAIAGFAKIAGSTEKLAVKHGSPVAFRRYPGKPGGGWVIAVHGSSGSALEMHGMAAALAGAGVSTYAIDIRGHGDTGKPGDIDYRGELEDDLAALADLASSEHPGEKHLLLGHSSGGSFTLRIAAGALASQFDGYLLLSPYMASSFPGTRGADVGGWVNLSIPRIIAISILDRFGITWFDGLPVIALAVPENAPGQRTAIYSDRLLENYSFPRDWRPAIAKVKRPVQVLIGSDDELFVASDYKMAFATYLPSAPVEIIAGVDHMAMAHLPVAIEQIVMTVKKMLEGR